MRAAKGLILKLYKEKRGTQVVEFAILLPVLLLLVFGIIDFGRGFFSWVIITNGAREGARAAAVGKTTDVVVNKVAYAVGGLYVTQVTSGACSITEGALCITGGNIGGYPDEPVTVTVKYNFRFIVLPKIMSWVGISSLPNGVMPLTAQSTMRLE